MRGPAYAAFSVLDPFLDIVRQDLAGLVDGGSYFDTIAPDAVFEFRYHFLAGQQSSWTAAGLPRSRSTQNRLPTQRLGWSSLGSLCAKSARLTARRSARRLSNCSRRFAANSAPPLTRLLLYAQCKAR
jgi:hypothetical protein